MGQPAGEGCLVEAMSHAKAGFAGGGGFVSINTNGRSSTHRRAPPYVSASWLSDRLATQPMGIPPESTRRSHDE